MNLHPDQSTVNSLPGSNPLPFAALPHLLRADARLSYGARCLAAALLEIAQTDPECRPSNRTLARMQGASPPTVKRWLEELEEAGWIRRRREPITEANRTGRWIVLCWRESGFAPATAPRLAGEPTPGSKVSLPPAQNRAPTKNRFVEKKKEESPKPPEDIPSNETTEDADASPIAQTLKPHRMLTANLALTLSAPASAIPSVLDGGKRLASIPKTSETEEPPLAILLPIDKAPGEPPESPRRAPDDAMAEMDALVAQKQVDCSEASAAPIPALESQGPMTAQAFLASLTAGERQRFEAWPPEKQARELQLIRHSLGEKIVRKQLAPPPREHSESETRQLILASLTAGERQRFEAWPPEKQARALQPHRYGLDRAFLLELTRQLTPPPPPPPPIETVEDALASIARGDMQGLPVFARMLAMDFDDGRSFQNFHRVGNLVRLGIATPDQVMDAYRQAMKPEVVNRGAVFETACKRFKWNDHPRASEASRPPRGRRQ